MKQTGPEVGDYRTGKLKNLWVRPIRPNCFGQIPLGAARLLAAIFVPGEAFLRHAD